MPILENSESTRHAMQARNLYQPDDPYAINQDLLTQTLDAFQSAGFDMRSSLAVGIAERITDNTPLVRDGAVRLAVEMGRRLAVNLVHENVGTLDLDAAFSKDPNRKVLTKHTDMSITPRPKTGTIGNLIQNGLGATRPSTQLDVNRNGNSVADPERELGGFNLYLNLGSGQKAILQQQQSQSFYQKYPFANTELGDGYSLNIDSYDFNWLLQRRTESVYSSYILDRNQNKSLNTHDRAINTLEETMQLHEDRNNLLDSEGFGKTDLGFSDDGLDDITRFLRYSSTDDTIDSDFGLKRGLVYYTQQMAKTNTPVGKALRSETIEYGTSDGLAPRPDGRNVEWKGSSECRSFTMSDQYGRYGIRADGTGNLMRFGGNGNPDSVLENSVMPRIYTVNPVKPEDNRKMMLSIENLAWSKDDIKDLPMNEQGPNDGRIMWFPPYGLTLNEQESPGFDKTIFLGRIEPVYSYNGTERKASLSFVILIDTPPHVDDYTNNKFDLGAFFAGCHAQERKQHAARKVKKPIPRPKPPVQDKQKFSGNPVVLYYQNDIDVYDPGYEIYGDQTNNVPTPGTDMTNAYSLNAKFLSNSQELVNWMIAHYNDKVKDYSITVNIEASSSALFKNNYNAQLSFRRAHELMLKVLEEFNQSAGLNLALKQPHKEKSSYASFITAKNIKQPVKFDTSNGRINFVITGTGEEYLYSPSSSDQESELNHRAAKTVRKASIKNVSATSHTKPDQVKANVPTKAEIAKEQEEKSAEEAAKIPTSAFRKESKAGFHFPAGWDKIDYYKPVFHSQTPYDFYKRYTFLHQITRPGHTIDVKAQVGSNSLFGRMPIVVLRVGDFFHTKAAINSIQFDMSETTWDMNPEGMGMQPMYCKITIDMDIIGGMSLKGPINRLQTAVDNNFLANSTYAKADYYVKNRIGYGEQPENKTKLLEEQ
jgi:hypothetical protein